VRAVAGADGSDSAEQPVVFGIDSGGKEEGVGVSAALSIAESKSPQAFEIALFDAAIDYQRVTLGIRELAEERTRVHVEGADLAAAEVADEQNGIVRCGTELAEACRGHSRAKG
jgi:hypothetical protein